MSTPTNTDAAAPAAPVTSAPDTSVAGDPSESGGTMTFDAARAMRDAFESGNLGTKPAAPEPTTAETPAPAAATTPVEPPAAEAPKAPSVPSADDLATALGGKPVEKAPEPVEELPEQLKSATKNAQEAFIAMRKEVKAAKQRQAELEAKLAEMGNQPAVAPEEIQQLKAQNEAYEQELRIARVEATREYKEAVVAPMERVQGSVKAVADKYGVESNDILAAFAESDSEKQSERLSDIASGMNDRDRFRLYEMADEWQRVQGTRAKVLANSKLALEKIEQHRQEQEKAFIEQRNQQYAKALDATWEDLTNRAPLFRPREGDENWNKQISEINQFARNINFDQLGDAERAGVAYRAASAPFLFGQLVALYNKHQEAVSALAKYQEAKPGAGGGTSPAPVSGGSSGEYEDFLSAVKGGLR